jgi:hypothetical protein
MGLNEAIGGVSVGAIDGVFVLSLETLSEGSFVFGENLEG